MRNCAARPAGNSTRAKHATAWRGLSSFHRLGEIRDRTYENQQHRGSGLNLLVTAIILWNTRYLERAVAALRQTEDVPDQLLAHLSPLGWEHVNLTGDYIWSAERPVTESREDSVAQGCARYRSQGRLSSWFVRLCVKSGRFVTSGLYEPEPETEADRERRRLQRRR